MPDGDFSVRQLWDHPCSVQASSINSLIPPGWNSVELFFDCSLEPQNEGVNIVNIFSGGGILAVELNTTVFIGRSQVLE